MREEQAIKVVFATDEGYFVPTYIAIYSMIINHKNCRKIDIYIFTSAEYPEKYKNEFDKLSERFRYLSICFVNVGNEYKNVKINNSHVKVPTMYRLLIPRILKDIDKCIYLDSDIVFEGDISEFYDIDIEDVCVAGVRDFYVSNYEYMTEWEQKMKPVSLKNYINAGVLYLNLKKIRELKLDKKMEEAGYNDTYKYNDQDVINICCLKRIKKIPLRFNILPITIMIRGKEFSRFYGERTVEKARNNPVIIHYIGAEKAWHNKKSPLANLWWKYAKMQNAEFKRDYIKPFLRQFEGKYEKNILEKILDCLKFLLYRLGLIFPMRRRFYKYYEKLKYRFKLYER